MVFGYDANNDRAGFTEAIRYPLPNREEEEQFGYAGALGGHDAITVEANFQYRVPLWPPMRKSSPDSRSRQANEVS
jgi:hypothetical protein